MKRTLASIGLAAIATGVLVFVALASRPIPANVHIAQNSLSAELEIVSQDYNAALAAFDSAWANLQPPSEAAFVLVERLAEAPARISEHVEAIPGNGAQLALIAASFESFVASAHEAASIAGTLLENLDQYTAGVATLRAVGPQTVQRLRDLRLDSAATSMFELVTGAVDLATNAGGDTGMLRQLLGELESNSSVDANIPREMTTIGASVRAVLAGQAMIATTLERLRASPVVRPARALDSAVADAYQSRATRIERARFMLAVYALLLLAAVAIITYRLKQSYLAVASANEELSHLNESLEQRVRERTEELENALVELKESQVQLVQAEKMSSLGQLVAGISHEINTPLLYLANNVGLIEERLEHLNDFVTRSVKAYGLRPDEFESRTHYQKALAQALNELKDLLTEHELAADIEEAKDLLGDCGDGLKDLTDMAQSLKDFSRLDRAPVGNFDVNGGLDKTLVIARNIIKHKAEVTKCYGDVPEIECSPSQINQVFLNLISNAAQAIESSGDIVLKTCLQDPEHVAISISDTGCGIPPDIIDKIKDPFFTTKEVGSGTGLGLSIAEEIVRNHGGELHVESKVGVGSKFTVILPIRAVARGEVDAAADEGWQSTETDPERLAEAS